MNRNIEAGCLVMVYALRVDTRFNGLSGTVDRQPSHEMQVRKYHGGIDLAGVDTWIVSLSNREKVVFNSSNLLRIDNYDDSAETTAQDWELMA